MKESYVEKANIFKALSEPNRLMIVDMLSCGELCACKILEELKITQPTLSHHMKILCDCGLVNVRREGKWMHYCINPKTIKKIEQVFYDITADSESCICKKSSI